MENKDEQEINDRLKAMQAILDRLSRNVYQISYIMLAAAILFLTRDAMKSDSLSAFPEWLISTARFVAAIAVPIIVLRKF